MRYAGSTHPGRRGGKNEDAIGWEESSGLWFVADGMGGHASGDVASRIVKETLLASAGTSSLHSAVLKAHEAVAAAAAAGDAHYNMGSTVVAVRIVGSHCQIVWVGDSRAYLWSRGSLRPLTRDHSYLEVLRQQGRLSETQMRGHPNKNLVTQTLGIGSPEPSVGTVELRKGDWILLCSDGLNDELEDQQIKSILQSSAVPDVAADALIAAALAHGGRDNVSAIVVEYDGAGAAGFLRSLSHRALFWLPIIGGMVAAVLVAAVWWWFYGR